MNNRFPLALVENKMLAQNTLNFSFSCKCQISRKYKIGSPEFALNT